MMDPFDVVLERLEALGLRVIRRSGGAVAQCPAHEDRDPSLSVTVGRDGAVLLNCHAKCESGDVLAALSLSWPDLYPRRDAPRTTASRPRAPASPTWTPSDARCTWLLGHGRVRDYARIAADHDVYKYLASRGLAAAWEESAYGILHPDLEPWLPPAVRWWPREGYRVVVPLFDQAGELVEIQARSIDPAAKRKTLFPRGGSGRGRMFASRGARETLLRCGDHRVVLLGEGLTDYLALVIASPVPVVAVAGVGAAASVIGDWVRGRHVIVALDNDDAGEKAVPDVADAVFDAGGEASRLTWPDGCKDACDLLAARGEEGFMRFLDEAISEVKRWPTTAKAQ